jgi:hypothetical protein
MTNHVTFTGFAGVAYAHEVNDRGAAASHFLPTVPADYQGSRHMRHVTVTLVEGSVASVVAS